MLKTRSIFEVISFSLLFSEAATAQYQPNPYVITFEIGTTHPAVKSYASTDTILMDSIPWIMPGVFLGTMTASDFKNGIHAARFRLTNNTVGDPAYMEMLWDLPWGVQKIEFYTAMYGNETGGQLRVFLSTDNGLSWFPTGDTIFVSATFDAPMLVSIEPALNQPVRVKIQKLNPSDNRIDVDDISITRYGTGSSILITGQEPIGEDVSIYRDSLKIFFDHSVIPNQGELVLHRLEGGLQTIPILSNFVSTEDSTAIIRGIQLQDDSHYFVTLSDSAFSDPQQIFYSLPIIDSLSWSFVTEDTIMLPDVLPLTALAESFLACNSAQNLMGLFKPYSVTGNQVWECSSDGHDDLFSVAFTGGFGTGVSAKNEDWLISVLPFDFSAMDHPLLSFWQKAIFDGAVVRTLRLSYDYPGNGNPLADSVSWITINVPGINQKPDNNWELVDGIDLTDFKEQPFYLAFTYQCDISGAYRLLYDDIQVRYPTGISLVNPSTVSVKVLGSVRSELNLLVSGFEYGRSVLSLYNFMGKRILNTEVVLTGAEQRFSVPLPDLSQGIYYLFLENDHHRQAVKFLKQ